jgi:hypothetical protein
MTIITGFVARVAVMWNAYAYSCETEFMDECDPFTDKQTVISVMPLPMNLRMYMRHIFSNKYACSLHIPNNIAGWCSGISWAAWGSFLHWIRVTSVDIPVVFHSPSRWLRRQCPSVSYEHQVLRPYGLQLVIFTSFESRVTGIVNSLRPGSSGVQIPARSKCLLSFPKGQDWLFARPASYAILNAVLSRRQKLGA